MTIPTLHPVILSGGSGTRLWPLSRSQHPKQLLPLAGGEESLLQSTARRAARLSGATAPLVIANEAHPFVIAEQLREIGLSPSSLLLEPLGRNTAPAAALAALKLSEADPEAILALLPADHLIGDEAAFAAAMETARAAAAEGWLTTFGIAPSRPETGYGYIKLGPDLEEPSGAARVTAFVEKPDRITAEAYLASGDYIWNSGMFVARADVLLAEIERLQPALLATCRLALERGRADLDFLRLDEAAFREMPALSFDRAIMEKTGRAAVVPCDLQWSDLGAWPALWEVGAKDADGNVLQGSAVTLDSRGNYLRSEQGIIATLGVENMIIISMKDAVLVIPRERADEAGKLTEEVLARALPQASEPLVVHRPWGTYEDIDAGPGFRVKRIVVKPGGRLSLQRHRHRSEHWVVVRGTAKVTCGAEITLLRENQSTYIPVGEAHRLENTETEPLHLIEVQCGDYVGEDDIERLDDVYKRDA
ncbi:MAG: mannose-1-phosphate guanylyltransferase/mannose-6-phosphate isomerase [Rhodovibrionaceae bacterium]